MIKLPPFNKPISPKVLLSPEDRCSFQNVMFQEADGDQQCPKQYHIHPNIKQLCI